VRPSYPVSSPHLIRVAEVVVGHLLGPEESYSHQYFLASCSHLDDPVAHADHHWLPPLCGICEYYSHCFSAPCRPCRSRYSHCFGARYLDISSKVPQNTYISQLFLRRSHTVVAPSWNRSYVVLAASRGQFLVLLSLVEQVILNVYFIMCSHVEYA
jgi:hypothetical protein